jgi:hypothetical protein
VGPIRLIIHLPHDISLRQRQPHMLAPVQAARHQAICFDPADRALTASLFARHVNAPKAVDRGRYRAKRTCLFALEMSAFDPKRTFCLVGTENKMKRPRRAGLDTTSVVSRGERHTGESK